MSTVGNSKYEDMQIKHYIRSQTKTLANVELQCQTQVWVRNRPWSRVYSQVRARTEDIREHISQTMVQR